MLDIFNLFKKGVRTSEFWLTIASAVYTAVLGVMSTMNTSIGWKAIATAIATTAGSAAYTAVRTWLKTHRVTAANAVATTLIENTVPGTPVGFAPPSTPVIGPPPVG